MAKFSILSCFALILFMSFAIADTYSDCTVYGTCIEATTTEGGTTNYYNNTYINQTVNATVNSTQFDSSSPIHIKESWLTTFIQTIVNALSKWDDYYLKTETYNKTQIDSNFSNYHRKLENINLANYNITNVNRIDVTMPVMTYPTIYQVTTACTPRCGQFCKNATATYYNASDCTLTAVAVNDSYSVPMDESLQVQPGTGDLNYNDLNATGRMIVIDLPIADYYGFLGYRTPHGWLYLVDLSTGAFTYDPEEGYTGTDTFTYRLTDDIYYSNSATVTITVG